MRSARTELMARILVVGGGYIGMYAARRLERRLPASDHVLTLVNPENFMLYQPFLPEVASGLIDPRAVVVPLRRVLRRTELVVGEVRTVDLDARRASVRVAGGDDRELDYDVVILGAGSWSRTLPIPGLAEHGVGFKDLAEAIWLRNRVLSQLDRAAELADGEAKRAAFTFVFVGAGFAGIEALGELEDLARVATRTIPALDRSDQRWVMVEAAPRILPELERNLASYAAERFRGRGIDIRTATRLERVEDGIVHLSDGEAFAAETLVWTAGVMPRRSPPAPGSRSTRAGASGSTEPSGSRDGGCGRQATSRPCRTRTESGNVAAHGATRPPSGQRARRQRRSLAAGRPAPHVPLREQGHAVLARPLPWRREPLGVRVRGFPAWFLHRTYHLLYMPTFSRKARIALDWTVALLFPRDIAQLGSLEHPRERSGVRRATTVRSADPAIRPTRLRT